MSGIFVYIKISILFIQGTIGVFAFFVLLGTANRKRQHNKSNLSPGKNNIPRSSSDKQPLLDTGQPTLFTYNIVEEFDHDPAAFTQGLEVFREMEDSTPTFIESTGIWGSSTVREVEIATGKVKRLKKLSKQDFGEGITRLHDRLYQLTWQSPKIISYNVHNFEDVKIQRTSFKDGWGITNDGSRLIIGDSTHVLYFVDPKSMKTQSSIDVTDDGKQVTWLNELEWVDGLIYANIWQRECIAQIDPSTGNVVGWVDLSGIANKVMTQMREEQGNQAPRIDVLNGIAWDDKDGKLYITGKLWPKIYHIELRPLYVDSKTTNVKEMTDRVRRHCILPEKA